MTLTGNCQHFIKTT